MSLKSLSKELLDTISGGDFDRNKLQTLARGIYRHANSNAETNGEDTKTPPLDNFSSQEDYDRYIGKLDPIIVHGYQLPQRFNAWRHKITPAMARTLAKCTYTATGHVAFWN